MYASSQQNINDYMEKSVANVVYEGNLISGAGGRIRIEKYTAILLEDVAIYRGSVHRYLMSLSNEIATTILQNAPVGECKLNVRFKVDDLNIYGSAVTPKGMTKEFIYHKLAKLHLSEKVLSKGMQIPLQVNVMQKL